jgi:hypothetical protein
MYSLKELQVEVDIMVSAFMLAYKRSKLANNLSDVFDIPELGVLIIGIDPLDYTYTLQKLVEKYEGYRYIILTCDDDLFVKKDEIIWELMRSGYLRLLRYKYQRQFNNLIQQGFGRKIITERLRIWGNIQKYKYLVEENKQCLNVAAPYLVAQDPAFFDYMPEDPLLTLKGDKNV